MSKERKEGQANRQGRAQPERRAELAVWAVLAVALILAALPTLLYPLTRDQGIYAYIADLMMHGGAPFRDAWELKPPAIYFVYWVAFVVFGRSEFAVRFFDVLYTLLSATTVYALAWESFRDRRIATLSAWFYAFCYYFLVHFHSMATPEAFMMPFLVVSIYGIIRGVRISSSQLSVSGCRLLTNGHWQLLGGVAAGFVFWFKPTAGLPIAAILAWSSMQMWRERSSRTKAFPVLITFLAGGLLGLLPIGLYLYGHGLDELLEIWRAYGMGAYLEAQGLVLGNGPLAVLDVILRYARDWQLLVWLSLSGAVGTLAWRRRYRIGEALVVFWLASLAAVLLQGKLFEYHWIPILAPTAILSAITVIWLTLEMRERISVLLCDMRNIFVVMVILGLALWSGYERLGRYRSAVAYLTGRLSAEKYYAQFNIGSDFSATGSRHAAAYLREHTKPDETALLWGVEPLVNFLAERRSPTNYISFYVLVSGPGTNPRLGAWRQDFLDDIRRQPPTYIILVENDITPLAPIGSRAQLDEFPAFKEIIETEYAFEAQVEDYLFYRRKEVQTFSILRSRTQALHGHEESFI